MRTLKEQGIYLHQFRSLEEARQVIAEFIARDNPQRLIARLGYRTPACGCPGERRLSEMTSRRAETEGRRDSRIDTDEGGRYVGIP